MRGYVGNLSASKSTAIQISAVPRETFARIDKIAAQFNVGRSKVVSYVLDAANEDVVLAAVRARVAQPQRKTKRAKYGRVTKPEPKRFVRMQDEVCKEIHGALPVTGCRYPNCGCKL